MGDIPSASRVKHEMNGAILPKAEKISTHKNQKRYYIGHRCFAVFLGDHQSSHTVLTDVKCTENP